MEGSPRQRNKSRRFTDRLRAIKTDGYREGHEDGIKRVALLTDTKLGTKSDTKKEAKTKGKRDKQLCPGEKIGEQ